MVLFQCPCTPYNAVIVGRRGSGRTTLVLDLLSKMKCSNYFAILPDEIDDIKYTNYIISTEPDQYLLNKCELFVCDGCILSPNMWATTAFQSNIPMIITTSYPPNIEVNAIDYVFLFQETSVTTRNQFFTRYASHCMDKEEFEKCMDSLDKYECLVLSMKKPNVYKKYKSAFIY